MKCTDATCGYDNAAGNLNCNRCGKPLSSGQTHSGRRATQLEQIGSAQGTIGAGGEQPLKPFAPAPGPAAPGGGKSGGRRKTSLEEGGAPVRPPSGGGGGGSGAKHRSKTVLDEDPDDDGNGSGPGKPRGSSQRAVGWMVSFDFNPAGQDYVIRAGKTLIGKSRDNDMSLFYDALVSDKHAVILHRDAVGTTIVDQDSTNGTKVNGEDLDVGGKTKLKSGDTLTIGGSTFIVFLLDSEQAKATWPRPGK